MSKISNVSEKRWISESSGYKNGLPMSRRRTWIKRRFDKFHISNKPTRRNFITKVFINEIVLIYLGQYRLRKRKQEHKNVKKYTKAEILLKIDTLVEQFSENARKKHYGLSLRSKKRSKLLSKRLFSLDNEFDSWDRLKVQ